LITAQSVTCSVGHTVLPATQHNWICLPNPSRLAGTGLTYRGEMEGSVDLGGAVRYMPRWFASLSPDSHPSSPV